MVSGGKVSRVYLHPLGVEATSTVGTHPIEMLSCINIIFLSICQEIHSEWHPSVDPGFTQVKRVVYGWGKLLGFQCSNMHLPIFQRLFFSDLRHLVEHKKIDKKVCCFEYETFLCY